MVQDFLAAIYSSGVGSKNNVFMKPRDSSSSLQKPTSGYHSMQAQSTLYFHNIIPCRLNPLYIFTTSLKIYFNTSIPSMPRSPKGIVYFCIYQYWTSHPCHTSFHHWHNSWTHAKWLVISFSL